MEISDLSRWFWPALSFLLASLWLWTLLQPRRAAPAGQTSVSGLTHQPVEVEDVLKVAHALREAGEPWGGEELARSVGLPEALAEEVTRHSLTLAGPRRMPKGACT